MQRVYAITVIFAKDEQVQTYNVLADSLTHALELTSLMPDVVILDGVPAPTS